MLLYSCPIFSMHVFAYFSRRGRSRRRLSEFFVSENIHSSLELVVGEHTTTQLLLPLVTQGYGVCPLHFTERMSMQSVDITGHNDGRL